MTGQQNEARFVNEWLALTYPNSLQWKRVRLGPLPNVPLARAFKVTQRWVDAIVYKDNRVIMIEAKLQPDLRAISQLEAYKELFYQTPEFSVYHNMPVGMIKLTTREDAFVRQFAEGKGIAYEVYSPPWLMQRLAVK